MNFTGVSSFDYVTGDLSEITIDNNIMPVRTGDAANHLRGIDVAFIKEAIEERRRAVEKTAATPSFSASITAGQMNGIDQQLLDMFYDDDSWEWLDGFPSTSVNGYMTFTPEQYPNFPTTMSGWNFGVNQISKPSAAGTISADDGLLASAVAAMYSKVGACKVFTTRRRVNYTDVPYTMTDLPYYNPSGYEPTASRTTVQQAMDSWGYLYYRYALGRYSPREYQGCEASRSASDLPTVSFPNSYAGSAKIYAVIQAYDFMNSTSIVAKEYMRYINDGYTIDNNALLSVANSVKGNLTIYSPTDLADMAGANGQQVSVGVRDIYCVYDLRDRTRWDAA